MARQSNIFILVLLFIAAAAGISYASGTSYSSNNMDSNRSSAADLYSQGEKAIKDNDFQKALSLFKQSLDQDKNNPNTLNMMAHSQLKLGMIDEALENYKKALEIKPRFPEAREYLGEAYIQAALREVQILKGYGSEGDDSLDDLTKAFKDAANSL
jgi:Tfp pilus assembly protein PilF